MKRTMVSLFCVCIFTNFCFGQVQVSDFCFFNRDSGLAVAGTTILQTTDAGSTWFYLPPSSVYSYGRIVNVPRGRSAITVGNWSSGGNTSGGAIFRVTDFGTTVSQRFAAENINFGGVTFADSNLGFATSWGTHSGNTTLMKTVDAGMSWTEVPGVHPFTILFSISFMNADTGVAVGDLILRTTDRGISWTTWSSGARRYFVVMSPSGFGIILGGGNILRTTNGGVGWLYQQPPFGISAAAITNDSTAVIVGTAGTIVRTTNRGSDWQPMQSGTTTNNFGMVKFLTQEVGFASGSQGFVRTTDGGIHWTTTVSVGSQTIPPTDFILFQNYPNPFNPVTTIQYALPTSTHVLLGVFNTLGEQVTTLVNRIESPGMKSIQFDASGLPSGVYIYRIQADQNVEAGKMLLLR